MTASRLVRLLTVLALLLMPLAMAGQGHAIAAAPHHEIATDGAGHCADTKPDDGSDERGAGTAAQCMMACAALPAAGAPLPAARTVLRTAVTGTPVAGITGLAPESETPPPRSA
jgi:hypothetical protein